MSLLWCLLWVVEGVEGHVVPPDQVGGQPVLVTDVVGSQVDVHLPGVGAWQEMERHNEGEGEGEWRERYKT